MMKWDWRSIRERKLAKLERQRQELEQKLAAGKPHRRRVLINERPLAKQ